MTKPRDTTTDAGAVRSQLDEAQRRWPQVRDRRELLLKLAEAGRNAIAQEATDRARAIDETAGALSWVYEPNELKRLREDRPEGSFSMPVSDRPSRRPRRSS